MINNVKMTVDDIKMNIFLLEINSRHRCLHIKICKLEPNAQHTSPWLQHKMSLKRSLLYIAKRNSYCNARARA